MLKCEAAIIFNKSSSHTDENPLVDINSFFKAYFNILFLKVKFKFRILKLAPHAFDHAFKPLHFYLHWSHQHVGGWLLLLLVLCMQRNNVRHND